MVYKYNIQITTIMGLGLVLLNNSIECQRGGGGGEYKQYALLQLYVWLEHEVRLEAPRLPCNVEPNRAHVGSESSLDVP